MKLQCGVLYRDGKNVTDLDIATVLGPFKGWNAETAGEVVDRSLAMAYRGEHITVEDETEAQPVRCGPYLMTWDGRLDNRSEVAARVGLQGTVALSDAELVLKAYAAVGEPILGDVIGEFALVMWREDTKEFIFARSVCGSRPLYYVAEKDRIVWSSDFAHLVRVSGVDLALNDRYIVEYLFAQPSGRHTPLKHVEVVPPGRIVHFQRGHQAVVKSFFDWDHVKPIRYARDEEYEEHFRELMKQAVGVRLRTPGILFSEMSGGLDSSSIVLIADEVLRSRGQNPSRLKTVSCVYEESESCDETRFIEAVERWRRVATFYVHEKEQQGTLGLRDVEFTGVPNPIHSFPGRYRRFGELAREQGARLLLTGQGGDHLFWSHCDGSPLIADELRLVRPLKAHRECRRWSQVVGIPYFRLLLGMALPLALDSLGLKRRDYFDPLLPEWLADGYRTEMTLIVHTSVARDFGGRSPSERTQRRLAEDLFATTAAGFYAEYRDLYVSHVYTHRPLVEFCVSIPLSQFARHGETRSLMRRALKDLLPGALEAEG